MTSQDTEITLGLGKLLGIFFALAIVCALFFSLGFSLGKSSAKSAAATAAENSQPASDGSIGKPAGGTAAHPTTAESKPPDMTFYKAVEQNDPDAKLPAQPAEQTPAAAADPATPKTPAPEIVRPGAGYVVQVAAVSKQEDAQALAEALRKKSYAVVIATNPPNDKLYHVQVGPFTDVADAESIRNRLVSDGYNPILKK